MVDRRIGAKSLILVFLMLLSSWTPLVSLHDETQTSAVAEWGSGGFNDTGWMLVEATGADPAHGILAAGDLHLTLAPGALVDNLTFEVRVNGSNGTWVEQPQLNFVDTQVPIFDWRGLGGFGQQNDLIGANPHSSRLSPNVDTGASWLLPGDAEITDLVIEALRPADTYVTFSPLEMDVTATAQHPDDGRLYMLIGDTLVQLDANNDPPLIEVVADIEDDSEGIEGAQTMVVDVTNDMLLISVDDGVTKFRAWSLTDSTELTGPFSIEGGLTTGQHVTSMMTDSNGVVWAGTNEAELFSDGIGVTSNPSAGSDAVTDMLEASGVIYLATDGGGVMRYDTTGQWLSAWDTQNALPSDDVVQLEMVNGVLMIALADAGIVRYNVATGSWLATWTDANWLDSNEIHGMAVGADWLHILAGNTMHHYNTTMGAFGSSKGLNTIGLSRSGMDLVAWPEGGFRAPSVDTVLVSDGSGQFSLIVPGNPPSHSGSMLLASGPNTVNMHDVLEAGNTVWVAGDEFVDRFDRNRNHWLEPVFTNSTNLALATDGTSIWVATSDDGVYEFSQNGTQTNHWGLNLNSYRSTSLAYDSTTDTLLVGHIQSGMSLIDLASGQISSWSTSRVDSFSNNVRAVAARSGIAYAASNFGVLRIDIGNDTQLSSWQSIGMDDVDYMPVETDGSTMYLGLFGYGVLVYDRMSGDIIDTWRPDPRGNSITSEDVYSLHIDTNNDIWVGTSGGADRWDGNTWDHIQPAGGGWQPTEFFDLTSDSTKLYAGTNAGACMYDLSSLNRDDCWTYYSNPGLPSSWVYSVQLLAPGRLYAGTNYGAGVIDTVNDTVLDTWEAGEATWNALTYEYNGVSYVGLNGVGVARFDRTTSEWLTTWDSSHSNNLIPSNGVTAMIPGSTSNHMWVGGDFGVRLIDLDTQTVVKSAQTQGSQDDPADLVLINNLLFASEIRGGGSNDNIYIYNVSQNPLSSPSVVDAGDRIGQSGVVYGMNQGPDGHLWIGVAPSNWWGLNSGSIIRWNASNYSWADDLDATGSILRVNSVYAGECAPLNISACHLFASYGEQVHRHFDYHGNLLNEWDDSVMEGPIRSIDLYQGIIHFATMDGIARYNHYNDTWLPTLTSGNGLPSDSEDTIFDIEIVGNDLWYSTMTEGGWNRNSRIFRMNGTTGQWTNWQAGSNDIPQGFGFSMEVCNDILHVAMSRYQGFGTQGGVARYDLHNSQWLSAWTQGSAQNRGLADDDAVALACDEVADIVYIGFEENDIGISRYSYGTAMFLSTISETANGISSDQVFPDGMRWGGGALMVSHTSDGDGAGGISRITTQGSNMGGGIVIDAGFQASSMELRPNPSNQIEWLIGRPGGDSGFNRVDLLNSTGLHTGAIDILAGLSSGRMLDLAHSGNDLWITCADDSSEYSGSTILEGRLVNGTVNWVQAYTIGWDGINELQPINNELWFTTSGGGMWNVDLNTGQLQPTPMPLHGQMHDMWYTGSELIVGLMGTSYTAAGVQVYNLTTQSWTDGALMAGLPSNIVRDFALYDNKVWIATYGGIGVWNQSSQSWEDSITTLDGLPTPVIEHIWVEGTDLLLGSPAGLVEWSTITDSVTTVYDRSSGLIGNAVSGIAYTPSTTIVSGNTTTSFGPTLFLSHNGEGVTRPGATEFNLNSMHATQQYQIDMLPSNDVRAICADWWGVHVATDRDSLVHWNAASGDMEVGSPTWSFLTWPISELSSDGHTLIAATPIGLDWVDVSGSHSVTRQEPILNTTSVWVGSTGIWSTTSSDGLYGFGPAPAHLEMERESMRRANPLTATFSGVSWDLTNNTHPGERISLFDASNTHWTPAVANGIAPGGIPIHHLPLTLSSPVNGAAVWVNSHNLNYTGTWNLTALNPHLFTAFDLASRRGALTPDGRDLHIQLLSPLNGSLEVRVTYDWTRSESPVELLDLYDRPDDGGGVVIAEWTPSSDHGWAAYRIYLKEGNWSSQPTSADLLTRTYDAHVPVWSITMTELVTVDGQPIRDGVDLYGVAVIEYDDGSLGEPSPIFGPATAIDDVPAPPEWAIAGPADGGDDGDLYIEWSKCTALDDAGTRVWAVEEEITDAIGLNQQIPDIHPLSNSTVLFLQRGHVYWIALTCVDESGQHDPANATIVGPVVPTGGVDDGIPPAPVEDIDAWDTPDDEGGRITVSWTPNGEEDCAWHVILARPKGADELSVRDASDFSNSSIVADCTNNTAIITHWGEQPFEDNTLYWVTVVACDFWGNCDFGNVTSVEVMSERNQHGSDPPPRVANLSAWDHADDAGEAIDVSWEPSTVDDFSFYVVWASNQPVNDLAAAWAGCKDDLGSCGLLRVDLQYPLGSESDRIEVTLGTALYGGETVADSSPATIRPNVPLSVTVTVHDLSESAFLTRLPTVVVTPIDNRDDILAPDRLDAPFVYDVPNDNGTAVYVDFAPSDASDLAFYEVYADVVAFTSIGHREPVMVVDRDLSLPLILETINGGEPIMTGIPIHVAVVPVDSSGNSHSDQLNVGMGKAYDNSGEDPGGHLPDVDFTVNWNDDGTAIEVEWVILTRTDIRNYRIYVSKQRFENTDEADMAKGGIVGSFWSLEMVDENTTYDNSSYWYITVSAFDGSTWKHGAQAKELKPFTAPSDDDGGSTDDGTSRSGILDLLDVNMILTIILSIAILTVLLLAFRSRRYARKDEAWELATAAWGLPQDEGWGAGADPDADLVGTLMPAAAEIHREERASAPQRPGGLGDKTETTSTAPTAASARLEELAADLFGESAEKRKLSGDDDLDSLIDDLL